MPTKIPWTDETWNPIAGCSKCSPGCLNCYAERMAGRLANMGQVKYQECVQWDFVKKNWSRHWLDGRIYCDESALDKPLHWKKPRRTFVNSMSDTFHEKVPFEFIKKIWDVGVKCPQHTLQILTKRPEIMYEFTQWLAGQDDISIASWPRNFHLGVSISTQAEADEKIPILLQIPAAKRFVSLEPILKRIDIIPYIGGRAYKCKCKKAWHHTEINRLILRGERASCIECGKFAEIFSTLEWVIIGAESINGRPGRECKIEYVRDVVQQCKATGTKVFVKQLHIDGKLVRDINNFPEDLQIQETI